MKTAAHSRGTSGELYVVATPIGNLADFSDRAKQVLEMVDLVLAEDTRSFGKLASHFGISTNAQSYHEHSERSRTPQIIEQLLSGVSIALVSDAGTPLISDPGYHLVSSARQEGIRIVPVPGACSVTAALVASGV